jgi:hypothetical protein
MRFLGNPVRRAAGHRDKMTGGCRVHFGEMRQDSRFAKRIQVDLSDGGLRVHL